MKVPMKQTLLCVDDDRQMLKILEIYLSPQGYKLLFSESGEDALKQLSKEIPDLILLDVMMPGTSGLEVLRRLRSDERTRAIPVVLLTGMNAEEDKLRGIEAGCDDFITKPFSMVELIVRVRSLLRISASEEALGENERLLRLVFEMSQPMIVCNPEWIVTNLNPAAVRYLTPGEGFINANFLEFIFQRYAVSIPRSMLSDCVMAPKTFRIEKKDPHQSVIQRAEMSLEIIENPAHEPMSIVLTLRDMMNEAEHKE
ncbi:MAG: response regulator [Candidatus Omnitrophota bacterium]